MAKQAKKATTGKGQAPKTIHKAFKFRIYPNAEQRIVLHQHFGHCRYVYNHFLAERIAFYEANKGKKKKGLTYNDNAAALTTLKKQEETIWLKEINSQSLQQSLKHLDAAYKKFFQAVKKGDVKSGGFPRFKSKSDRQSFTVPQRFAFFSRSKPVKTLLGTKKQSSRHSWLKIPNLPKSSPLLQAVEHRKLPAEAKILYVTLSKTPTGKYFASLTCELPFTPKPQPKGVPKGKIKAVGIDLGIKDLVATSDGVKIPNPKHLQRAQKKLKYLQRQHSKKKKGGINRERSRKKLARAHERVANTRKDTLHKVSAQLIEEQTIICTETLKVKNMMKNHKLAQSIADASWGEFVRQLNYKADHHHRVVVQIDTFFASSKTCNVCSHKLDELPLSVRKWKCPKCKHVQDRDVGAAKNILQEGLRILKVPLSRVV